MSVCLIDNAGSSCLSSDESEAEQNVSLVAADDDDNGGSAQSQKKSSMDMSSLALNFRALNLLDASLNLVTGRPIGGFGSNPETTAGPEAKGPADDGAGGPDQPAQGLKIIALDEVAWHDTLDDCWMVVYDYVYELSQFIRNHPGGQDVLLEYAGRDATLAFVGSGHSRAANRILEKYLIGELPPDERIFRTTNGIKIGDFV